MVLGSCGAAVLHRKIVLRLCGPAVLQSIPGKDESLKAVKL
jgi:hypothetical protein